MLDLIPLSFDTRDELTELPVLDVVEPPGPFLFGMGSSNEVTAWGGASISGKFSPVMKD